MSSVSTLNIAIANMNTAVRAMQTTHQLAQHSTAASAPASAASPVLIAPSTPVVLQREVRPQQDDNVDLICGLIGMIGFIVWFCFGRIGPKK